MDVVRAESTEQDRTRKRITKACDQCNSCRSKCNGAQPCARCKETGGSCTYNRQSRRHGRVSKAAISRKKSATAVQALTTPTPSPALPSAGNVAAMQPAQSQWGPTHPHGRSSVASAVPVAAAAPGMRQHQIPAEHAMAAAGPQPGMMNTAAASWMPAVSGHGDGFAGHDWISDPWLSTFADTTAWNFDPAAAYNPRPGSVSRPMTSVPQEATGTPNTPGLMPGGTPRSQKAADLSALRYPVLRPVVPYLSRIMSITLACNLLDSYVADFEDGVCLPTSPLLLTHIYRRDSLLSTSSPRPCSPALLASMLLVSAHTTESPFFGSSPAARMRLYQQLLQLTLDLLEGVLHQSELRKQRAQVLQRQIYRSSVTAAIHPEASMNETAASCTPGNGTPGKTALDDIVAYMHVALVTTTAESKPAGSRWWHTAFQLAREFKLNRDGGMSDPGFAGTHDGGGYGAKTSSEYTSGSSAAADETPTDTATSPMSVSDDTIVEPGDARITAATVEEREVRRRVWWTLYIWDRQLALRYNSPLAIKDAESRDTKVPIQDDLWQSPDLGQTSLWLGNSSYNSLRSRPTGPPLTCVGTGFFDVLLPLMCILGQIIDLHNLGYHPRVGHAPSNLVTEAYIQSITKQLADLEPSILALDGRETEFAAADDARKYRIVRHQHVLGLYGRFLLHLLYSLLGGEWDKLTLLEGAEDYTATQQFHSRLNHSLGAADAMNEIRRLEPDLAFKSMFFGIFMFHGATLPWLSATHFKQKVSSQVFGACETYVRMFEASNCTYYSEFLRKMRKLMVLGMSEATTGIPLSKEELHLRSHILKLYRWTGDGTGLGL